MKVLKLVSKQRVDKSLVKSLFCNLGEREHFVINELMSCYVSSKDHFVKVVKLMRKSFYFCQFCDNYVHQKSIKP